MKLQPTDIMQVGDIAHRHWDDMVIKGWAGHPVNELDTFRYGTWVERPGPEPAPTLMVDKCPSCGSTGTLFIGAGGYLTCSLIGCPQPGVGRAIAQLREHVRILREALEEIESGAFSYYACRAYARAALEETK